MDNLKLTPPKVALGLFLTIIAVLFTGCQKEDLSPNETILQVKESSSSSNSYDRLLSYVFENNIHTLEELQDSLGESTTNQINELRSASPSFISPKALWVISSIELFDKNFENLGDYEAAYIDILNQSGIIPSSEEYQIIKSSISSAIRLIEQKRSSEIQLRAWSWDDIGRAVYYIAKCVGGTTGSAILGGLAGAGVGTVTLPLVGTVSGSALGAIGGGLTGAASFC